MSKTEPTPGPWIVHNDGYGNYVMAGLVEIYNPHDTENRPDYDANACLIAAAKDMFALLNDILEWDGILDHSKTRIRGVIAKATC